MRTQSRGVVAVCVFGTALALMTGFAPAPAQSVAAEAAESARDPAPATRAAEWLKRVDWNAECSPDTLLVGFESGVKSPAKAQVHAAVGAELQTSFDLIPADVVKIPAGRTLKETAEAYAQQPGVEYVEPNYVLHLDAVPNDPSYSSLWGMKKIRAPMAWNEPRGARA